MLYSFFVASFNVCSTIIVAYEIFSVNKEIQPRHLLAVQALKVRWPKFYNDLTSNSNVEFRRSLEEYASMNEKERTGRLREMESRIDEAIGLGREYDKSLLAVDPDLWNFLSLAGNIIFKIENWEIYRRAAESTKADLTEGAGVKVQNLGQRFRCAMCKSELYFGIWLVRRWLLFPLVCLLALSRGMFHLHYFY
jgi:hypothetical protein